ncbi:CpsD/CapB family tyrosine-protein kinase [Paenibacillus glufosinatiresistens]|uniref:CpsD/CapB family tyrosine-protein kinase n=1 Tax=Paenibacillus glufosinatiresistens TaxID=3070657 RepID=UPI00286DB133|nr:CpsD/CapB family tyrosine-protein kinase [Paenibacillus sp. YX.27]
MGRKESSATKADAGKYLITAANPDSALAEQYRTVRNRIRTALGEAGSIRFVVSSPLPGEGKTTSALNLAVSFAGSGGKVLLIDTHFRRPGLAALLDAKSWPGLTDGLTGNGKLNELVQETGLERIDVLAAGSPLPGAGDLLNHPDLAEFLEWAAEAYPVVIIDAPAVLDSSAAVMLAGRCDGCVLVLHEGRTGVQKVQEAKRVLELGKARLIGAVLNRSK